MTSTGPLISARTTIIWLVFQLQELQSDTQLINNNNNYVNLHDVTNLGLYNKLILVTQKQVLELYVTVIERKTLYGLGVPHTTFPNATRSQLKQQQKNTTTQQIGPCYQHRNRDLVP